MIAKQTLKGILASTCRSHSLLLPSAQSFSKLSDQLRSGSYRSHVFKSSNFRFHSNDFSLLTYYFHPSIEDRTVGMDKYY
jgi:hypothetical protein